MPKWVILKIQNFLEGDQEEVASEPFESETQNGMPMESEQSEEMGMGMETDMNQWVNATRRTHGNA